MQQLSSKKIDELLDTETCACMSPEYRQLQRGDPCIYHADHLDEIIKLCKDFRIALQDIRCEYPLPEEIRDIVDDVLGKEK